MSELETEIINTQISSLYNILKSIKNSMSQISYKCIFSNVYE